MYYNRMQTNVKIINTTFVALKFHLLHTKLLNFTPRDVTFLIISMCLLAGCFETPSRGRVSKCIGLCENLVLV
jgi:hypothetical protein